MKRHKKGHQRKTPWALYSFLVNAGRLILSLVHGPWL